MEELSSLIEAAWKEPTLLSQPLYKEAVEEVIQKLDEGKLRCASPQPTGEWIVHEWVKKAILLFFRLQRVESLTAGDLHFRDKVPPKQQYPPEVRVVPPGIARYGSYLAPGVVLMPGYVNIGAYVGEGTMIDTWATVGSCAQVGRGVHISGGVGIGGVLEPPQARPVIIEDGAFIGSRSIIVEGVRVGEKAVIGAGVILTASMPIIDVTGTEPKEYRGEVPPRAVVISGMREKVFPAGRFGVPCALIIGWRRPEHDEKLALNALLRKMDVPV
ncbi:MAG: 2,3,4,5-tetrahydropyridine-2,6-dicarboxylate N-succinyltransferase [Bacteroidia bacterium]|nr:2,3,4,5-tetrahydropyridine-2,6-dicarboxylate N-succinyltransferase [Bacteroidia bacterium]MCX7764978.1 2,3,4,5-tetrahydropyridine-2,6-dicarboxylate N-succinyltransferase [Bacteroidia bacterium]MDW8057134.1 2,3,4,5-tetrahydropyridine-2,6-dicarboxylate N-succinyltransferase [Bacteroidia bacterium]